MEKINLLIGNYREYCVKYGEDNSMHILNEFQTFLVNLAKNDGTLLKIKYTQYHAEFLLSCISDHVQLEGIPFTFLIQILNVIFRFAKKLKVPVKNSIIAGLSWHLQSDEKLRTSAKVIDNVIWLVGRSMQMARDRTVFVTALTESKLIEICLTCPYL